MSDYELLTVVLMILGIIVPILIAYINTKSNRPQPKDAVTFLETNF